MAILAVDGGNSKTDVALVAADGRLLAALRGPTTSHQQVGMQTGADRLAALVGEARARAGTAPDGPGPEVGLFALAGADTPADTRHLTAALAERRLAGTVLVVNDAFAPIRAGSTRRWGIALICGSGMNAAGIAPDGRTARLAALGGISGDWGGGGDVGLAALGAAVRARDGRGPRTALETLVPRHFGYGRPIDLTRAIELGSVPESRLRELSPLVFRAAGERDPVARSIVDRLADELVAMAGAMIRRLNLTRSDPDVVMAGGVFDARDDGFEARIAAGVHAVAPKATLRRSDAPPVLGAALLGLDRLASSGAGAHEVAEARLRADLRGWEPPGG
ncbi:MAG: ATPase [Chloroflexi bacterium]|nr:ATPase [Chloroflexota bacterium]